jgi:hypothetical protein
MPAPQHRAIVLGASNVAIGIALVVETACRAWGRPLDVLAAVGHGRSYGKPSRVLARSLPGILQCALWEEWRARAALPTAALLTDIGNDILFGAPPEQIADWVRDCLERLRPDCSRIVVTELPLASVERLGPRQYVALRTLIFPRSQITWEQALRRAELLNRYVLELAGEFDAAVVRPERNWYGLDPIHIHRRHRRQAWSNILTPWRTRHLAAAPPKSWLEHAVWWNVRPKYRRLFGIEQHRAQPAVRLADGTCVSLY